MANVSATMSTTYVPMSSGRLAAYRNPSRMVESPAGGVLSAGGMERIRESATSEKANVAASMPNVNGIPNVAIDNPASAGPAMAAIVPRSEASADTAGSSSVPTSFGVSDSSAGLWKPVTADMNPATT